MPELPEVETIRLGLEPYLCHNLINKVHIRETRLRWAVSRDLKPNLIGTEILSLSRRGKYLLLHTEKGTVLVHLGMSGRLRILSQKEAAQKHDHIDIEFADGRCLRYTDPRRFGAWLWCDTDVAQHPLLRDLGVEPLSADFTAEYCFQKFHHRRQAIKNLIMDAKIVVGVGNIYANEALFLAGIKPNLSARKLTLARTEKLVLAIKQVLQAAIRAGGTTIRDYQAVHGELGYFAQKLKVYGRADKPCMQCQTPLKRLPLVSRQTVYCPSCQR